MLFQASRYYDPALTVLTPEAVLSQAKLNASAKPAEEKASALSKGLLKLTSQESTQKLSRLSSAAQAVEVETELDVLEQEIEQERRREETQREVNTLFDEIKDSSHTQGEDPLAALEREIADGPTDRRVREVQALIDDVDMAATPNTRRKKLESRRKREEAAAAANRANTEEEEEGEGKNGMDATLAAKTAPALKLVEETFKRESRRMEKEEQTRSAQAEDESEKQVEELIRAADEAEREAEESTKTRFVANVSMKDLARAAEEEKAQKAEKERQDREASLRRAEAEAKDRALKQAAAEEERKNREEREARKQEEARRKMEEEERKDREMRAEMELKARQEELDRQAKEKAEEDRLNALMAQKAEEMERKTKTSEDEDLLSRMEAAKARQIKEKEDMQKALLEASEFQQSVTVMNVDEMPSFTPITTKQTGPMETLDTPMVPDSMLNLDTPDTVKVEQPKEFDFKDDFNVESLLSDIEHFNLDTTLPGESNDNKAPANRALEGVASSEQSNMRASQVAKELEGLDDLVSDLSSFSIDANDFKGFEDKVQTVDSATDDRDGGLRIEKRNADEDIDVDAAMANLSFDDSSSGAAPVKSYAAVAAAAKEVPKKEFSTVTMHDTAKEVVDATHKTATTTAASSSSSSNAFDDFKLDLLDTQGTKVDTNVDVDFTSLVGSAKEEAKAEVKKAEPVKAAVIETKKAAEEKRGEIVYDSPGGAKDLKAKFDAQPEQKQEQKKVNVVDAGAEVKNDEASSKGFGSKMAMFEQQSKGDTQPKTTTNKKKNRKKKKK